MSFSSLYVGATGVVAHGDRMQVVGNNLANVSTVGYKKADAQFTDIMSKEMTGGGARYQSGAYTTSQIGMGVAIGEIRNLFTEGGLESTTEVTDLAITGNGFFGVREASGSGATHFTRAGNFRFNNEAYLVDPHDNILQGYPVDRETGEVSGTPGDIQLPYEDVVINGETTRIVRNDPRATTNIEMISNLDALAPDNYSSTTNPFFAMLDSYDGTNSPPFAGSGPAYNASIKVFDENGTSHDLTTYYDPVDPSSLSNAAPGFSYWEYLIAAPGESDGSANFGTSSAGLAGLGVLTFNSSGDLVGHSAYSLAAGSDGKNLSNWGPSTFSAIGEPQMQFTFGSNGGAGGAAMDIAYTFGVNSASSSWASGAGSAAAVGNDVGNLTAMNSLDRGPRTTTSVSGGSSTYFKDQDGYAEGFLLNTSISREGFLRAHFTNGEEEDLYQVAMYNFVSEWGLRRDGANNFVATEASGAGIPGLAEEGGRGTIQQNTLEMSNVDMAEEFANMILTQRGYQANTKVITTSDSLLNTTITMKR